MRIAVHGPNFIPHFPFFYKMAMVDKFIILRYSQFENERFHNRFNLSDGRKFTKPVLHRGLERIFDKDYVNHETSGRKDHEALIKSGSLYKVNMLWIEAIKATLDIKTELVEEPFYSGHGRWANGTARLISIIKNEGGTVYVTNESAREKYLDENAMRDAGIEIEYCRVPRNLQLHTFEILMSLGVTGAINNLPKRKNEEFAPTF